MKIYDTFMFNGETKILNFRLHELNDYVDYFIFTESIYTHQGNKKELIYPQIDSQFEKFKDKIIYVPCIELFSTTESWHNEQGQRKYVVNGLNQLDLDDNDVLLHSDADEIPDSNILAQIKNIGLKGSYVFPQHLYYYNTKCRCEAIWKGTVTTDIGTFKALDSNTQKLRASTNELPNITGNNGIAGWHFSYFGNEQDIIRKLKSFAHTEFNNDYFTNPERIKQVIEQNADLFDRGIYKFSKIQDESYLPKYVHLLN